MPTATVISKLRQRKIQGHQFSQNDLKVMDGIISVRSCDFGQVQLRPIRKDNVHQLFTLRLASGIDEAWDILNDTKDSGITG